MAGRDARERTALIATVLNEVRTVAPLLESIAAQSTTPDEIVIVDGGSTDGTWEYLQMWRGRLPLRLIREPGCTIARGRNLAIGACSAEVLAVTDAGVRLESEWLTSLLGHLTPDVDVVSGFFAGDAHSTFERALGATVLPALEDVQPDQFLPSSRSLLVRHSAWAAVGGYPEWLDYCEDLVFDLALKRAACQFAFAPSAVAYFRPRESLLAFFRQYFRYARGDGKADLWPRRHALRYVTYLAVPWLVRCGPLGWLLLVVGGGAYVRRPLQRLATQAPAMAASQLLYAAMLIPIIRLVGDVAKMLGYPIGVFWRLQRVWTSRSSS